MSSKAVPETPKAGGWTLEERLQLMTQILATNHVQYNIKLVKMPGRTHKAIQHQWGRIKTEMQAFIDSEPSDSASASASKPKSAGKKRGSDTDDKGTPAAKKRAAAKMATAAEETADQSEGSAC
ncbi:hypothetical protein ACHAQA_006402 [Verticillium albo-atrum]